MSEHENKSSKRPLLGLIMLREGMIDDRELSVCVTRWTQHRDAGRVVPFGEVVVELGFCTQAELGPFLSLQRKLAGVPGDRKPLGIMLIENALLTPTQVVLALRLQRATGQRLGELLVEEELLREPQVEVLLRFQARAAGHPEVAAA